MSSPSESQPESELALPDLPHRWLGRMGYLEAYETQLEVHGRVLSSRDQTGADGPRTAGELLTVEHPPVITVPPRPAAGDHVLAGAEQLAALGIERVQTDRGGDVTYHGPGQLVVYPIVDLSRLGIKLHEYLRVLEDAIMATLGHFGVESVRDSSATGVWIPRAGVPHRKIAAIGIRVRRWVTLHGLALNVDPDLTHFQAIVPCGLHGRPVTSLRQELGDECPSLDVVRERLVQDLRRGLLTNG